MLGENFYDRGFQKRKHNSARDPEYEEKSRHHANNPSFGLINLLWSIHHRQRAVITMGYGHQRDQKYDRIFARDKDEMTVLDIGIIAKPEQWNENKTRKNGDPKMFGRGPLNVIGDKISNRSEKIKIQKDGKLKVYAL